MSEKIKEIQQYNVKQQVYNINQEKYKNISEGNLEKNIVGSINTCPISNDFIIKFSIDKDINMKRFNEFTRNYEMKKSYNIFFETHKGKFVYTSALNSFKTLDKYNDYMNLKKAN